MPGRREPKSLKEMTMLATTDVVMRWMDQLLDIEGTFEERRILFRNSAYRIRNYLGSLPFSVLNDMWEKLLAVFVSVVSQVPSLTEFDLDDFYKIIAFPCLEILNIAFLSTFLQTMTIRNLFCFPNLTMLVLPEQADNLLIAINVNALPKLQVFEYRAGCNNDILENLCVCCKDLIKIQVQESLHVNDISVPYLLTARKLKYLNVKDTNITTECYRQLIQQLPNIQNISWHEDLREVLRSIRIELANIEIINATYVTNLDSVVHNCKNITDLSLEFCYPVDVLMIRNLLNLKSLALRNLPFEHSGIKTVLEEMGRKLEKLSLCGVSGVDICDIISLCPTLEVLNLESCIFKKPTRDLSQNLEQFITLKYLTLIFNVGERYFNYHLKFYKNISHFCGEFKFIDDQFLRESINGFKNIIAIISSSCQITPQGVSLIIRECSNLKILGYLKYWNQFTEDAFATLKNEINQNNIQLLALWDANDHNAV